MTDTATSRYGARQQSQGSNTNTWGDDKLNEVLRLLDRGSKGYQALAMTGDTTLTWTSYVATNTGQCAVLKLTGSLSAAASLTVPSVEWQWDTIWNTTGQTVTVKTSSGTGVAIPNGRKAAVFCDGTDCYLSVGNIIDQITLTNNRDLVDKNNLETALANSTVPAAAGTVLVSATDTTAGYLAQKIVGSGAVSVTTINSPGNEDVQIAVGDGGLTDGGLQSASFAASSGSAYVFPVGGTVTLPAATGSRRKIGLSPYGDGITTLSGTVNGLSSFPIEGNQTVIITDSDASEGWV